MKLFRVFVFVFLYTLYFVLCPKVNAQDCTDTNDPEFHSLRPYPGSPCLTAISDTASFCGDSLTLTDNIKITYNPGTDNCVSIPGGKVRCTYSKNQNKKIKIELSEAELPIMGNTEDVTPNASPDMPDAQKVNEYVSWYLNGVINRAEYPFLSWKDKEDIKKIINFSGPIRKLLPQRIQDDAREKQVNDAREVRHNQIVACTYGINLPIPIFGGQIGAIPGPCVDLGFIGNTLFKKERRLIGREYLGDTGWKNHLPPKREEYSTYDEYYKAYRAWRGDKCYSLPIPFLGGLEIMLCFDNPLHPNFYGDLYPYIPFSSTEDRKGEVTASGSVGSAPGVTISNVSTSFTNATLYFAHMQEATELASTLQDTFAYKGADKFAAGNSVPVNTAGSCKMVDVRSGPGDSLLPTPTSITGNIAYTATFTCDFDPPTCSGKPLPPNNRFCETEYSGSCVPLSWACTATFFNAGCPSGYKCGYDCSCNNPSTQTCTKAIPITIATTTKTPLADKIWAQLVSGTSSVFRRIFPKLGSGSQIGEVKDIPASTKVTYSGDVSGTGDLNFPHIGGISEYFLKGIQTMLRPKGYGEVISFGTSSPTGQVDICSDLANCNQSPGLVDLTGVKEKFVDLATRWLGVGHPRIDMYETVVGSAQAVGVDPIFTLAIWLNESGASNYDGACQVLGHGDPSSINCQRAQDFGINNPSKETQYNPDGTIIVDHFMDQLQIFLGLPNYYYTTCKNNTAIKCPMEIFGAMFKWGVCNPTSNSNAYTAGILGIYGWLKPSQAKPCYPIALPQ